MPAAKEFRCRLIGPEGLVFDRQVVSATLPAQDGQVGVLAGRAPMVVALGSGVVGFRQASGESFMVSVEGGLAEMRHNVLTILPERAGTIVEKGRASTAELEAARREIERIRDRQRSEGTEQP